MGLVVCQQPKGHDEITPGTPHDGLVGAPTGERHVWSLGHGVSVELTSNAPLTPRHLQLLARYVALAAASFGDDEPTSHAPLTHSIQIESKDPDGWQELLATLEVPEEVSGPLIQWGEYATVELELDARLQVVGGRLVPHQ